MGQHTWFHKNKQLFLREQELFQKLDNYNLNEIYLSEFELLEINIELEEISSVNSADYHDLFRSNKRNIDNSYTDDVIFSRKECFEWIDNPDNLVTFSYTILDSDSKLGINRTLCINRLNEFWDKHPDGVIEFG